MTRSECMESISELPDTPLFHAGGLRDDQLSIKIITSGGLPGAIRCSMRWTSPSAPSIITISPSRGMTTNSHSPRSSIIPDASERRLTLTLIVTMPRQTSLRPPLFFYIDSLLDRLCRHTCSAQTTGMSCERPFGGAAGISDPPMT
jgi:hypothetical protein